MLIRALFPLHFMDIYTCYYEALMVVLSFLLLRLYVGYKHGFMTEFSYVSHRILTRK